MVIDKPFVKVIAKNSKNDWSDVVTQFLYEDCVKKANMLELRFSDSYALEVLDSTDFRQGAVLEIQWGYINNSVVSKVHTCVISDIEATYQNSIQCVIRCLDAYSEIKESKNTNIWNNVKSSDIAKQIAKNNGLLYEVEGTSKIWKSLPQVNQNDLEFIETLALKETDGNFTAYIRGNTLYFKDIGLKSSPIWEFKYGDEDFLRFSVKTRKTTKNAEDNGLQLVAVDAFDKKVLVDVVEDANLKNATDLGKAKKHSDKPESKNDVKIQSYDFNGDLMSETGSGKVIDVGKDTTEDKASSILGCEGDAEEKTNLANKITKDGKKKQNKATLLITGNPALEAGSIIAIKNVALTHSGNWYLDKVKNVIDASGFKTSCEMSRPLKKDTSKSVVNNKEVTKKKNSVSVTKYDVNGNKL